MLMLWLAGGAWAGTEVVVHRFSRGFVNVFALEGDGGVVVVDSHFERRQRWLLRKLDDAELSDRVTLVVLTHAHSDHAGGAAALADALDVPVAVGAGDLTMLQAGDHGTPDPQSLMARLLKPTIPETYPAHEPELVVETTLSLAPYGVAATAELVRGHTPGSLAVTLWEDQRVLSGDLIRSGITAKHRPKLHFFHEDRDVAHDSLRRLLDEGASELIPSHGGTLSTERVLRWLDRHAPG